MRLALVLLLEFTAMGLAGCVGRSAATVRSGEFERPTIRSVRFENAPEVQALAEHARQFGNSLYPKIGALLGEETDPKTVNARQIDIVFKKDLGGRHKSMVRRSTHHMTKLAKFYAHGATRGSTIYLDAETLAKNSAELEATLLHEMAHVAQGYKKRRMSKAPFYWCEGIADYVSFKLRSSKEGAFDPKCSALWPHYTSGYDCAAAFLLYLEGTYGSHIVPQLHAALRHGSYTDGIFREATGKRLDVLWAEFLGTRGVTSFAAKMNSVYAALGYSGGKPPRDAKARFKAYVEQQPGGVEISRLLGLARLNSKAPADLQTRIAVYLYFVQPGGAPLAYLHDLKKRGELPGFAKGEDGLLNEPVTLDDVETTADALVRNIHGSKPGDKSMYHYSVTRCGGDCGWRLERAWRTSPDGRLLEEYAVAQERSEQ